MNHKIRDYIASRLGIRSQGEMGIELGRCISEGIADGYKGGRRMTNVGFKRLTDTAVIPTKAHPTDSGFDLYADETVIIEPSETKIVKTGIAVVLPQGYEATVRCRSGITSRTKLRVHLGTVDNAYRGDIGIIVDNVSHIEYIFTDIYGGEGVEVTERRFQSIVTASDFRVMTLDGGIYETAGEYTVGTYIIRKGDKLAQLVVSPVATFAGVEITDLDDTTRGSNGFGSTGV